MPHRQPHGGVPQLKFLILDDFCFCQDDKKNNNQDRSQTFVWKQKPSLTQQASRYSYISEGDVGTKLFIVKLY